MLIRLPMRVRPLVLLVCLAAPLASAPGRALPDLTVEIDGTALLENQPVHPDDVAEGCAGGTSGRRLLRFGLRTWNLGADDLVLGDPDCPDCSTNPGAACANPLYQCSPAHGHAHFEDYALAELLDGTGQVVAVGQKQGFCLLDSFCPQGATYNCSYQGISAGCADVYGMSLPCQYIDLTDVALPDGVYTLRVTVDFEDFLDEEDEGNNAASVPVAIGEVTPGCGNGIVDGAEACDDGNTAGGDCCSADCLLAAADGTACEEPGSCLVGGQCSAGDCEQAELYCDPCLQCVPPQGCIVPPTALCEDLPPARSQLTLRRRAGAPEKDRLSWSWVAGAPVGDQEFGSPADAASDDLSVCVYDEDGLVASATAAAGAACGSRPCWKERSDPARFRYRDGAGTQGDLRRLHVRAGPAGKARISARAKGALGLPQAALPGEVTVRLQRSGSPSCWQADFSEPRRNDFRKYKARVRD